MAGIVARISWGNETTELKEKLSRAVQSAGRQRVINKDIEKLLPETLFLLNTFSWIESTPSPEVGALIEETFWTCNQKTTIAILSTKGIMPSSKIRIAPEELGFVDDIPTLPGLLADVGLIKKLIVYGIITDITISDIKSELEGKALNAAQLQRFLEWLGHNARKSMYTSEAPHFPLKIRHGSKSHNKFWGHMVFPILLFVYLSCLA